MPAQSRPVALSDLHDAFPENRKIVENLRPGIPRQVPPVPEKAGSQP